MCYFCLHGLFLSPVAGINHGRIKRNLMLYGLLVVSSNLERVRLRARTRNKKQTRKYWRVIQTACLNWRVNTVPKNINVKYQQIPSNSETTMQHGWPQGTCWKGILLRAMVCFIKRIFCFENYRKLLYPHRCIRLKTNKQTTQRPTPPKNHK